MQALLQHAVRKDALHKAYIERKKKGARTQQSAADAVKISQLTGGVMFKVQHTACDDAVLELCREMEAQKNSAKTTFGGPVLSTPAKKASSGHAIIGLIPKSTFLTWMRNKKSKEGCTYFRGDEGGSEGPAFCCAISFFEDWEEQY